MMQFDVIARRPEGDQTPQTIQMVLLDTPDPAYPIIVQHYLALAGRQYVAVSTRIAESVTGWWAQGLQVEFRWESLPGATEGSARHRMKIVQPVFPVGAKPARAIPAKRAPRRAA